MTRCIRTAPHLLLLALLAASCRAAEPVPAPAPLPDAQPAVAGDPQDAFFAHLASLCGRAFRGEALLVSGPGFEGEMIMHVRRCTANEIQIPLHVGENRSRTWIITRTAQGLRLKHDHRIEDGTDDPVTQYGGDTAERGTATRQSFPADAFTAQLLPEAATNVWTITLTPGQRLHYHLTRHGQPRATFQFDLTDEVTPPPAPWGYEGT
jgi:hypothetical protein